MKKTFSARRVPRKIGSDEDDGSTTTQGESTTGSSLKRPVFGTKKTSQIRRLGISTDDEEDSEPGVRTPKRSGLSRIAIQRNAGQRSSFQASELPQDEVADTAVPTYSAADLEALKASTPSAPAELDTQDDSLALQLNDKFGSSLAKYGQSSAIPSAAEIAEKKQRRARLAMEHKADEYISLDPDDSGLDEDDDGNVMRDMDGRLVLREKDRYGIQESRLVRDDEDVMEGFDEFTGETGSRITMGASALPGDEQARKDEIARQIAEAEDPEDDELDDEERTRNAAFEAAQTRHGTFNTDTAAKFDKYAAYRAKTPAIMTPIPTLDAVIKRFRAAVLDIEARKQQKQAEMLQLSQEKLQLKDEEERVQRQLKEVAEKYRQIKIEKGFLPPEQPESNGQPEPVEIVEDADDVDGESSHVGLGMASAAASTPADDSDDADRPRMGLGMGSGGGLGWPP